MPNDLWQIWMQSRLPAGDPQVTNSLAIEDLDGIKGLLPTHIFPTVLRVAITSEIAEAAIGVAGTVTAN